MSVSPWPCASVPVAVPVFSYRPRSAVPVAVQVISSPASSTSSGQLTETPWSSVTAMLLSVLLPVFVTT